VSVHDVPKDIGYDSCRSRRELQKYTKITSHLHGQMWHFHEVENSLFSFWVHLFKDVLEVIYAISPVSLFGCVSNFGPKFQIILNCLVYFS
jgi:hypothetical protein